ARMSPPVRERESVRPRVSAPARTRTFPIQRATDEADRPWQRTPAVVSVSPAVPAAAAGMPALAGMRVPLTARLWSWRRPGAPDYALVLGVAGVLLAGVGGGFCAGPFCALSESGLC